MIVRSEEGIEGYASGDHLPDRAELERHLKGLDARRVEIVRDVCETVDFHGGRTWTLEVAVWDLVGRALGQPVHLLLGGRNERISAYASSGELVSAGGARAPLRRAARLRACAPCKIRFHHTDWRRDVDVVAAVRDAVGPDFQLMVDANQGWRMPGDRQPRWDVATALQCARALEPLGVYWLEEPLPTTDLDGYRALRSRTDLRIAAGEMVRTAYEARDLRARRSRRRAARHRARGRVRRLPPHRRARRAARPRVVAAHLVERLRLPRQPARCARALVRAVRRGPVRPADVVDRAP